METRNAAQFHESPSCKRKILHPNLYTAGWTRKNDSAKVLCRNVKTDELEGPVISKLQFMTKHFSPLYRKIMR